MTARARRTAVLVIISASGLFVGSYQVRRHLRFELGPGDEHYVVDASAFHPARMMSGPERLPGGRVQEARFGGRLTRARASLMLPYHVIGAPVELRIRCHRFGLGGTLAVFVNGAPVNEVRFRPDSYPWGVPVSTVPRPVASQGPLRVELVVRGGSPPPSHLPEDFGVGLDWMQVRPLSRAALVLPTVSEALGLAAFLITLAVLFVAARLVAPPTVAMALMAAVGAVSAANVLAPLATRRALDWLWGVPLLALLLTATFRLAHRRRPQLALRLATLGLGTGIGLAVLETGARVWEDRLARQPQPIPEALPLLRENPHGTGSLRLKPDLDLTTRVGGQSIRIRTNRHGMHWRDVPDDPSVRQRVAFLGDSFTFGCWVPDVTQSFVGIFDTRVVDDGFEALNFGVGGYGLADAELLLREEVPRFKPRYVIVAFYNGNDFRDTYLGLHKDRLVNGASVLDDRILKQRVPAIYRQPDRTTATPTPERGLDLWLRGFASYRLGAPLLGLDNLSCEFAVNQRFISYSFWSRQPYPPVALEARDASLRVLLRMRDLAATQGARMGIVTLPTRDQVCAREPSGPQYDTAYPQAYVAAFALEHAIPYLDLLPEMRDYLVRTNRALYVEGDTHFNVRGHRLAGEQIADWFGRWRSP